MKSAFDTLAMINSRIVSYLEIGLCYYLTKHENYIWDCCVNAYCGGGTIVLSPPPLQNEIPTYETRITTAKLLIESEEYEVKMLCVFAACLSADLRRVWHLRCVCVRKSLCSVLSSG